MDPISLALIVLGVVTIVAFIALTFVAVAKLGGRTEVRAKAKRNEVTMIHNQPSIPEPAPIPEIEKKEQNAPVQPNP